MLMAPFQSATFAAALSALIYFRWSTLYLFYSNAPSRLPHINNVKHLQVKFADRIRNCEDMAIDTFEGFVILSCDPGRGPWNTVIGPLTNPNSPAETGIYLWDYESPDAVPEKLTIEKFDTKAKIFHPLGIDYVAAGRKLFVVNHSPDGVAIELFKLSAQDRKISHMRTMSHELLSTPNAVAAFNGTQFFATNDHHFTKGENPTLSTIETYLGLPGGTVVHGDRTAKTKHAQDVDVKVMDRVAFANGVAFLNATTIAVASCARAQVLLYHVEPSPDAHSTHPTLSLIHKIPVPFLVDNLKSDKRGTLFLAGHPYPPSIEHMASNAAKCASSSKEGCEEDVKGLSWISEWSEEEGLKHSYVGDEYPTSTTMIQDTQRGLGFAVGLYAKGILTWVDPAVE